MKRCDKTPDYIEKKFVRTFHRLSGKHQSWSVWQDFIFMSAMAIANRIDKRPGVWHKRENEYLRIAKKYSPEELTDIAKLCACTMCALAENPAQDFLGKLYMRLELSSHWHGQFFTPWHVAVMMAKISAGEGLADRIREEGYISVNDPACGAGCMLLAFADVCREQNIDYSKSVLFVAQDIDPVAAKMCYIQMSVLGCAGYVIIGNTITEPVPTNEENIWITPMYCSPVWTERRNRNE